MTSTVALDETRTAPDGVFREDGVTLSNQRESYRVGERDCEAAERFLSRQGYSILERGWCCSGGSVDLVAQDGDCLVFADVVTRDGTQGGGFPPEPNARLARRRMEAVATTYLGKKATSFSGLVRFDVVSILLISEDRAFVRHHIGAFSGV